MIKKTRYLYWLPAILFASLIFYISGRSNPPGAELFSFLPASDKLAHMAEYFILSMLIYLAFKKGHALKVSSAVLFSVVLASLYGASDEFHQKFTPGRSMDILDWLVDTAGAFVAMTGIFFKKTMNNR